MPEYRGDIHAPDFPPGAAWLNTQRPLSMRELRGKVVLLDFWTFCCINCMHILPDLKKLEHKYRDELVVVGVHSAKFAAERETENIRQAVLRYEIEHPVVNDTQMWMWRQYGVRAWPTVALIDPEGKVIGGHSGEGIFEPFDQIIGKVVEVFDAEGKIDRRPLGLMLEAARTPQSLLSFPGKVLADPEGGRLFIADSNHNRIVVAALDDGTVEEVIGDGEIGLADGDFDAARFHHPNGLALDGDVLYIADTENHAIRRADLGTGRVETVAGTGRQSRDLNGRPGPAAGRALNSPWDLVLHEQQLYIAMAGMHQIWKMDLATRVIGAHAGSGREAHIDGPLEEAALAQPSGVTTDGRKLFFADSEVSSIRAADIDPRGRVTTIVGQDLFDFGDIDGIGEQVRLQHPLGVVWVDGSLYVADTYNNKIKWLFPETRAAVTFAGSGRAGLRDGSGETAEFDEPAGITATGGRLYIADTNNHVIRTVDLATREVSTFQLRQVRRLARWRAKPVRLEPQKVRAGAAELRVTVELPEGHKWNPDAPIEAVLMVNGGEAMHSSHPAGQPIRIPFTAPEGESLLQIGLTMYYCDTSRQAVCLFQEESLELPLQADGSSANAFVELPRTVGATGANASALTPSPLPSLRSP
ncbi:MAG: redoxin domain-containing protein [Acidobacteria bacterium]|nr:redoxin domain-containing protein [Acidobacteriota bacterium]